MIPEIDDKIINDFRKKVNDNNHFVRLYFVDYKFGNDTEGKDIWSKICSCMDWLNVAVGGVTKPEAQSDPDISSLNLTQFLITVDMILEAVNHLWISIGSVNGAMPPYKNDRSVFCEQLFGKECSDEEYFKTIRAWFGVHAVNGNEETLNVNGTSKKVRFFSSWSTFIGGTWKISLYSNNSEAEEQYGGIKEVSVNKVVDFAVKRYETLIQLADVIDNIYQEEVRKLQMLEIEFNPEDNELNQVKSLYKQSVDRKITSEFYAEDIKEYIQYLSCDLGIYEEKERKLVEDYLLQLKAVIPVYFNIVQNVDTNGQDVFDLFHLQSKMPEYGENFYYFSKVSCGSATSDWCLEVLIKKGLLPEYSQCFSNTQICLLFNAIGYQQVILGEASKV